MQTDRKRTQRDYTLAFKLAVVEAVEKGELTYKQAQRKDRIQGRSTVLVWLRKHGLQDWSGSLPRGARYTTMENQDKAKLGTPEQRIKELQIRVSRDRLFDVLRAARLLVKPYRAYHKTTDSHHRFRRHPNLLKDGPQKVVPYCSRTGLGSGYYLPSYRPKDGVLELGH